MSIAHHLDNATLMSFAGSFRGATGRYRVGDVAGADPGPDCVCLMASRTPARFGLIARLTPPWHGF